jgi:ubiquinone/menaquinone biosynthesis C-methylase UbiE
MDNTKIELKRKLQASVVDRSLRSFDAKARNYLESGDGIFSARLYDGLVSTVGTRSWRSILDVGCGNAVVLSRLSGEGRRLCGLDLSPEMVKQARIRLGDAAELKVGRSDSLPWPDGSFDVLLCSCSFHHYPDPASSLAEFTRVLAPGGRLVLADPTVPLPVRLVMNFCLRFSDGGDAHIYGKRELLALLEEVRLSLSSWRRMPNHSFILVAEKR